MPQTISNYLICVGQRDRRIPLGDLLSGRTLGKRRQHSLQCYPRAAHPHHAVVAEYERYRFGRQRFCHTFSLAPIRARRQPQPVAVLECTSRKLLPQKYRDADRTEIIRRVNELESLTRR